MLGKTIHSSPLVLASASPRRREILERLGFTLEISPANIDENAIRHANPAQLTLLLADAKVRKVATAGSLAVAADTIVVVDGAILEKPIVPDDARRMLGALSGRGHLVYTAVSVSFPGGEIRNFLETTQVFFVELSVESINAYVATTEPYDKAGGYGVQDTFGMTNIHRIEGCYFNVMGFPASRFMRFLSENQKLLHL